MEQRRTIRRVWDHLGFTGSPIRVSGNSISESKVGVKMRGITFLAAVVIAIFAFQSCKTSPPVQEKASGPVYSSQEETKPEPVKRNLITAYTASWCGPCKLWKAECYGALLKAGWEVKIVESNGGPVPRFEIESNGRKTAWTGYSGRAGFTKRLKDFIDNGKQL